MSWKQQKHYCKTSLWFQQRLSAIYTDEEKAQKCSYVKEYFTEVGSIYIVVILLFYTLSPRVRVLVCVGNVDSEVGITIVPVLGLHFCYLLYLTFTYISFQSL